MYIYLYILDFYSSVLRLLRNLSNDMRIRSEAIIKTVTKKFKYSVYSYNICVNIIIFITFVLKYTSTHCI